MKVDLSDSPSQKVSNIGCWKTTSWIHQIKGGVSADKHLRVPSQAAPSVEAGCSMCARRSCPCSHRAAVSLARSTADCLDALGTRLPVTHPVWVDQRLACWHIEQHNLVLTSPPVLARDLRDKQDPRCFPGSKPSRVVVSWWVYLVKDIARNVLGNL